MDVRALVCVNINILALKSDEVTNQPTLLVFTNGSSHNHLCSSPQSFHHIYEIRRYLISTVDGPTVSWRTQYQPIHSENTLDLCGPENKTTTLEYINVTEPHDDDIGRLQVHFYYSKTNKKFWEEPIRLISLHKTFIWITWI
jgi:hypothetical protein